MGYFRIMRIGIDCRMAGTGEGIGRYVEELMRNLALIDHENEYFLLFQNQTASAKCKVQSAKFRNILTKSKYYSWAEQSKFIWELKKLKLDLMHFPNFNVPIFYPGKFIITIHDIIHHHFPGKKKARLFHRLAYRATIRSAVRKARKIIAVSWATKDEIIKTFKIDRSKVAVIYEGVSERFQNKDDISADKKTLAKYGINEPYLLFVGVWRQYKNLERLAEAFDILTRTHAQNLKLVLAGKIDPFYPEIKDKIFSIEAKKDVLALGFVSDEDLLSLYKASSVFVLPSLVEGFGLIGLEAQAGGVPIAASNIPVMREILDGGALFFDPHDAHDMADKILTLLKDRKVSDQISTTGVENVKKFNWLKTAEKTIKVYDEAVKL